MLLHLLGLSKKNSFKPHLRSQFSEFTHMARPGRIPNSQMLTPNPNYSLVFTYYSRQEPMKKSRYLLFFMGSCCSVPIMLEGKKSFASLIPIFVYIYITMMTQQKIIDYTTNLRVTQ